MSSVALFSSLRGPQFTKDIQRLQALYSEAQSQLASGRPSDVALALGSDVGRFISLESRVNSLDALVSSNGIVKSRLEVAESAVGLIQESGDAFSRGLIAGASGLLERDGLAQLASVFAQDIESFGKTSYGGAYILSGASSDQPAVRDFLDKSSAGRVLVSASFRNTFGIDASDPAASSLSPPQIEAWLQNGFAEVFSDENWRTAWTDASGTAVKARIADNQSVSLPSISSDPALRKVVMASVLMLEFSESALNDGSLNSLVQNSLSSVQGGLGNFTSLRAANDVMIKRLEDASDLASRQKDIYAASASSLINVDSYELAVRIESLRTRLEASYMTTARLSQMSLANYL